MNLPLRVDYYSDILCVWAWIAQRRIDELNTQLGDQIALKYHYLDVFGDATNKIPTQWRDRDGFQGFAQHVQESAASYQDAPVNTDIWSKTRPTSSANPHLVLKAIELAYSSQHSTDLALKFRQAFFIEAIDISHLDTLLTITQTMGLDRQRITEAISDGSAMASLMQNYQQARSLGLKGSPTYIIDNGRQILYGNVGYRVLLANVEEQLRQPADEASWC